MGIKIKICGLRSIKDVAIVDNLLPDYVGFILAPSKRRISKEKAISLKKEIDKSIKVVGVFVNEQIEEIVSYVNLNIIDIVQLHGDEDISYIKKLKSLVKIPIIKAIRVNSKVDLDLNVKKYLVPEVDYLLFDKKVENLYGGSGQKFDWDIINNIGKPYFLAGGINSQNINEAMQKGAYALDLSSSVETDGHKDFDKVKELIDKVRKGIN